MGRRLYRAAVRSDRSRATAEFRTEHFRPPANMCSHTLEDGGPINFWQCEKPKGAGVLLKTCKGCDAAIITAETVD